MESRKNRHRDGGGGGWYFGRPLLVLSVGRRRRSVVEGVPVGTFGVRVSGKEPVGRTSLTRSTPVVPDW